MDKSKGHGLDVEEMIEFSNFVCDHLIHHNTIPAEFESSKGSLLDEGQVWNLANDMGLSTFVTFDLI